MEAYNKMIQILKRVLISLMLSSLFFLLGYLLANPISNYFHTSFKDIIFYEGIILVLGTLASAIQGNPSGVNLQGLGMPNAVYISNRNLETSKTERNVTNYYKNFKNNGVVKLTLSKLTLAFGGIFLIIFSLL